VLLLKHAKNALKWRELTRRAMPGIEAEREQLKAMKR
jgi:hypothetical protein